MTNLFIAKPSPPKILVVEDDHDLRELCRNQIVAAGFEVETCENGQEAIAFLDSHQAPCLILLDMMMPIMNGREFMSAFSSRPHTVVPIPVYLVSGTANKEDGKAMGCLGFLKKPVDVDVLISIVRNHCNAAILSASEADRKIPGNVFLIS